MKPQSTLKNARVIKKIGKWTIEMFTNINGEKDFAVTNGRVIDYPFFNQAGFAYHYPELIPKYVKRAVEVEILAYVLREERKCQ